MSMPSLFIRALLASVVVASSGCAEDSASAVEPEPANDAGEDSGGEQTQPVDEPESIELHVGDFVFDAVAQGPVDGEVVILLHGFPETSYEWRSQLPALAAAGYRAVAPNQRGY